MDTGDSRVFTVPLLEYPHVNLEFWGKLGSRYFLKAAGVDPGGIHPPSD